MKKQFREIRYNERRRIRNITITEYSASGRIINGIKIGWRKVLVYDSIQLASAVE